MMRIADRPVGDGYPCYVIAEAGINHNGDLAIAKQLIYAAVEAGADCFKLQKRTVDIAVPAEQRDVMRDTPWGAMRYIDYKRRIEFDDPAQWRELIAECDACGLDWMASCWDTDALAFIEALEPPAHKVASASVTDLPLLQRIGETNRPVIMSTGMSTTMQVVTAMSSIRSGQPANGHRAEIALLHCNSSYPCEPRDCNLMAMHNLRGLGAACIGYSGHERGIQISLAAIAMGARIIERHLTLDRTMWGTDHAASLEPKGFAQLVRDIRIVEEAMGDGVKRVTESELPVMKKLRRVM